LEASLIEDEKYHYFDEEGDLLHDTEFFEEKMQKMVVVDYEENPILTTTSKSATLSARSN